MRQVHQAGEKALVDFSGKRPTLMEPTTGEVVPVELFVGVLGASSYVYAEACPAQDLASWGNHKDTWLDSSSAAFAKYRYSPKIRRTSATRLLTLSLRYRRSICV
jgi:transposase